MQHQVLPSEPRRSTLLLADDHPMMREDLKKLLEPDFEVIGVAATGREMIEIAERWRPDLIIADISMPGLDGLEAMRRLKLTLPGTRVLILSIHTEPSWVGEAFEAGACGYLTKSSAPEEIESAVREVLTVRTHLNRVYDKLGSASRVELALLAARTDSVVM